MIKAPVLSAVVRVSSGLANLLVGDRLPESFRAELAPQVPLSWRLAGIFWVDGADHEPGGWELILMPPLAASMLAKAKDPEIVHAAVVLFSKVSAARSEQEAKAILHQSYKEMSEEKGRATESLLQQMYSGRKEMEQTLREQSQAGEQMQSAVEVLYLHETLLAAAHRRLKFADGIDQLVMRQLFEESTNAADDDDAEETETETPAQTPGEGA